MKRVAWKFTPKLIHFDKKNHNISMTQELLNDANDADLIKMVMKNMGMFKASKSNLNYPYQNGQ